MFVTGQEIFAQSKALITTEKYLLGREVEVRDFLKQSNRFVFMGCGSSYMLSKTGANLFSTIPGINAFAIAGGDYIMNPKWYRATVKDSIVIMISRSGMTTEMLRAADILKKEGIKILSLTMKTGNDMEKLSDLNLDFSWAFDYSVCQTRSVSNFYAALVYLRCIYTEDKEMLVDLGRAIHGNERYLEDNKDILDDLTKKPFENIIVLADGCLCGVAEEGALAFTEIAMLTGKYFNILDYRHGPIVLNDEKTLTIVALQPGEKTEYEVDMVNDLKKRECALVVLDDRKEDEFDVDCHLYAGDMKLYVNYGLPLISACQMIAYNKAVRLGINPDHPEGITAFVELK